MSSSVPCRFIPCRRGFTGESIDIEHLPAVNTISSTDERARKEYSQVLSRALLHVVSQQLLSFRGKSPPHTAPVEGPSSHTGAGPSSHAVASVGGAVGEFEARLSQVVTENRHSGHVRSRRVQRYISQSPERILDAPELVNDFYLNLVDWSCDNVLAVALGAGVYLWNASNGEIKELAQVEGVDSTGAPNYVTSLAWAYDGKSLTVGTSTAVIQVWDTCKLQNVRNIKAHSGRVSSMCWTPSHHALLTTGGRDSLVMNHDLRKADPVASVLSAHRGEVCGMSWSPDATHLATGGNDNMLYIWDAAHRTPRLSLDKHVAAVKAIAWCPFNRNILASGGGTADRTLRLWDTTNGTVKNSVDTRSQVCSIVWSKRDRELVSSHGFSDNQLVLWRYSSLAPIAELTGHTDRVLNLAQSPDGATIVSLAADETLRFWRVFRSLKKPILEDRGQGMYSVLNIR